MPPAAPLITNDAVVLGLLAATLGVIFYTVQSNCPFFKRFYTYVPAILLCYFIPSLYNSFGLISGEQSRLYFIASRYLLPAVLVLLTLSIDFPAIVRLGPKALAMFLTGTAGIILGGPIVVLVVSLVSPETVGGAGPDAVWRGGATDARGRGRGGGRDSPP